MPFRPTSGGSRCTMSHHFFTYRSLEEIKADVERFGLDISFEEGTESVSRPVQIGPLRAGNSLGIHPMEGCDGTLDGRPDELTFRRWERFGRGGAKLIWGEATAVVPEGRMNPRQLLLSVSNRDSFARLLERTRQVHREEYGKDDDLLVGLQLTHSGRYSFQGPILAYHNPLVDRITYLNKKSGTLIPSDYPVASDEYLERLEDRFASAAKLAFDIGFDFVDMKQCHTYLLSELLGATTRQGKYGGSFENRTRFARNVIRKIRDTVGPKPLLASRINVFDGVPFYLDPESKEGKPYPFPIPYRFGGFGIDIHNPLREDLREPKLLVRMLVDEGVQLVNITMGSPYYNMHYGRPFERAPIDGYESPEHPLFGVDRHFRFTEEIQKAFPDLAVVGTGYSWLREYMLPAAESNLRRKRVTIVAVGRGGIAYPDYARDALTKGSLERTKVCLAVSYCTALMRAKDNELGQYPTGCVPRDPFFAPIYKETLSKQKVKAVEAKVVDG
jgi:NADPH2 dehydrogenase